MAMLIALPNCVPRISLSRVIEHVLRRLLHEIIALGHRTVSSGGSSPLLCSKRLDYSRKDIANASLRLDCTWRIRVDLELASQTQDLHIE